MKKPARHKVEPVLAFILSNSSMDYSKIQLGSALAAL